ncbi:MAG: DNA polymerase III subunit delta' [Endomicrobiia bacterium]
MSFNDIIGQEKQISLLKKQILSGRIPHSYLFIGSSGVGKKMTAIEIAKFLNCKDSKDDSCGECPSCIKIEKGIHPDVHIIDFEWQALFLEESIEKQTQIKIDSIRELQREISLRPSEGRWKIFIIDNAEKLSREASNCLLKTLEEPPENSILILLTTIKDVLPQTVISRCQCVQFSKIKDEDISIYLKSKFSISEDDIKKIVKFADGSIGKAIELLENMDQINKFFEFCEKIIEKDIDNLKILDFIELIPKDRTSIENFLDMFLVFVRNEIEKGRNFSEIAEIILEFKHSLRYNVNTSLLIDIFLFRLREFLYANSC